jgi:hypothetical protein
MMVQKMMEMSRHPYQMKSKVAWTVIKWLTKIKRDVLSKSFKNSPIIFFALQHLDHVEPLKLAIALGLPNTSTE